MLVTLTLGQHPNASELRLPPNGIAAGQFNSRFHFDGAVDCSPTGFCAAVSTYKPKSGLFQAWAATTQPAH